LGNFTTDKKSEGEGLDLTEHGEIGFDLSVRLRLDSEARSGRNRRPPNAAGHQALRRCCRGRRQRQSDEGLGGALPAKRSAIDPDFKEIYPCVTTVQGNRFRLRGGDPKKLSASIQKLFLEETRQAIEGPRRRMNTPGKKAKGKRQNED